MHTVWAFGGAYRSLAFDAACTVVVVVVFAATAWRAFNIEAEGDKRLVITLIYIIDPIRFNTWGATRVLVAWKCVA